MHQKLKDTVLDQLAALTNVAQFISFGPDLIQRFSRVHGYPANFRFSTTEAAVESLLKAAPEGLVNVRSFKPDSSESSDFIRNVNSITDVIAHLTRLSSDHFFTIVNETINMTGGAGGVSLGGLIEFAPQDTPRCVEKPGVACLPKDSAIKVLETVYRFNPKIDYEPDKRVEFTIHLERRGWLREHTVIWELETIGPVELNADIQWPNLFSEFVGVKAYGLLLADAMGLDVPLTTVLARGLPPFSFGNTTGTGETWLRTCPAQQEPGRFTTPWLD